MIAEEKGSLCSMNYVIKKNEGVHVANYLLSIYFILSPVLSKVTYGDQLYPYSHTFLKSSIEWKPYFTVKLSGYTSIVILDYFDKVVYPTLF